jgi:hypothetical protein
MPSLAGRGLIFLASAAFTSVFFIQFCATVFQCGCQPLWAEAARHCNIHNAHGRQCPFCIYGTAGYALSYGAMLAAQAAASFWPYSASWVLRLSLALGAFPLSGLFIALIFGLITGYWN